MDKKNTNNSPPKDDQNSNKIDPAILEKSLKILKAIGKGNGIKEGEITVKKFTGETLHARALTTITLTPLVSQKLIPGRDTQGKVVENEAALNSIIARTSNIVSEDETTEKKIKDLILKREDQGFAIQGLKQKLHELKKHFCLHVPCQTCHTNGKISCTYCRGIGKVTCPSCQGNGHITCTSCRGTGTIQTANGPTQCTKCQGRGRISCHTCQGRGQINCQKCAGTGKMACQTCAATGWMTKSAIVEQEATFLFDIDKNNLPENIALEIKDHGIEMLSKHDIEANITELHEQEKTQLNESQIAIGYDVRLPYGTIDFGIKEGSLKATLMGYQGRLINCPSFLQNTLAKPIMALKKAAQAPSNKTQNILQTSCKARLIRETLKYSAEYSQKNALKALKQKYPYGIEQDTLKSMIKLSRKCFLDLTRSGRYKGLTIGLFVATAITALYYFVARQHVITLLPLTTTNITILDSIACIIGMAANITIVQAIGKKQLSKNLYALLKQTVKVRANQVNTGKTWIWSLLGNIILFFFLSWIALQSGVISQPPWWPTIL